LQKLGGEIESRYLIDIYRDLENIDNSLKSALDDSKTIAEDLLKKERNRLFNNDKEVFHRLAKHLETLQQDNEPDYFDVIKAVLDRFIFSVVSIARRHISHITFMAVYKTTQTILKANVPSDLKQYVVTRDRFSEKANNIC
jgi:hypothetical protein